MRNRINNILIGLLWLLAATLGTSFWFNTMFGFNIFSAQHWQYFAYMQASSQPVKPAFYISMIVAVLLTTFVLYWLLRPRFRQITLPIIDRSTPTHTVTPVAQPVPPAPVATPQPQPKTEEQPALVVETPSVARPPRLNIPTVTRVPKTPVVPLTSTTQPRINPETEYADIRNVFESAGYVYKGAPRIKNVQTAVVAIGTDEVLWVGAVGVTVADMQRAIQALSGVFTDTLEDIEININAFIIASPDSANTYQNIMQFASVDALREYVSQNPNTPPDPDEVENFDAYSGYIGTVVDYIGKI